MHEIVQDVHRQCIRAAAHARTPTTMLALHRLSVNAFQKAFAQHRLDVSDALFQHLYPHSIGHYLGLDLHDTPTISVREPMGPGAVFTIEPGLYFPPHLVANTKSAALFFLFLHFAQGLSASFGLI